MSTRVREHSLVSNTRILGTAEARDCYDSLCKKREDRADMRTEVFSDTVQAFYVAAAIGHLLQRGQRYVVKATKDIRELLSREQWDRPDKKSLKMAFTYLAKLEYGVASDDDVLQVVAELAERGIRHIKDRVSETGDFDFITLIEQLRKETTDEQPPGPGSLDLKGLTLQELLKLNEAWNLEFKSSMLWDYEEKKKNDKLSFVIAKTICSLANSEGGIIVIGVSDKKEILGLEYDIRLASSARGDLDGFEQHFINGIMNKYFGKEKGSLAKMRFEKLNGKDIAIVEIEKAPKPGLWVKYKDGTGEMREEYYIRSGSSCQPLNSRETTEYINDHWP
jgi:hypothetical protein